MTIWSYDQANAWPYLTNVNDYMAIWPYDNTPFSISNAFFSTQIQRRLTFSWIELQMLLNTYNYHYTETHFIFSIFVFMSWCRSISGVSAWSTSFSASFLLSFIISPHLNRRTCFFVYFLEHFLLFLDDNVDEGSK